MTIIYKKNNSDNVSISINYNYQYNTHNQNECDSKSFKSFLEDLIPAAILFMAIYLYYENKIIVFVLTIASSMLYFAGLKEYSRNNKIKIGMSVIILSFFISYIISIILCVFVGDVTANPSFTNLAKHLYALVSIYVMCIYLALFTWCNTKQVLNYVIHKLTTTREFYLTTYERYTKHIKLFVVLFVSQILLLVAFIYYFCYSRQYILKLQMFISEMRKDHMTYKNMHIRKDYDS